MAVVGQVWSEKEEYGDGFVTSMKKMCRFLDIIIFLQLSQLFKLWINLDPYLFTILRVNLACLRWSSRLVLSIIPSCYGLGGCLALPRCHLDKNIKKKEKSNDRFRGESKIKKKKITYFSRQSSSHDTSLLSSPLSDLTTIVVCDHCFSCCYSFLHRNENGSNPYSYLFQAEIFILNKDCQKKIL